MGKDSAYYKDKAKMQKLKLRELIGELPDCAADYIYSKELGAQSSTLISYAYDLLTFFRFLLEKKQRFARENRKRHLSFDAGADPVGRHRGISALSRIKYRRGIP